MCMYLRGHHQQISWQIQAPPSQPQDIPCQANSSSSPQCSIKGTTSTSVHATDQDSILPKKDMFPVTPTVEQVLSASPDNVSMY